MELYEEVIQGNVFFLILTFVKAWKINAFTHNKDVLYALISLYL
jgi:hypothetical protein